MSGRVGLRPPSGMSVLVLRRRSSVVTTKQIHCEPGHNAQQKEQAKCGHTAEEQDHADTRQGRDSD